jgi:hypothetical protein
VQGEFTSYLFSSTRKIGNRTSDPFGLHVLPRTPLMVDGLGSLLADRLFAPA